ncbi:unnamed protein product [Ilex paraguariensis]|uniref:Uncharacterized protein n=1 Tax=Ilex paraguariensis TaxID=185542 RepID=A0ABC8QXC4_9AQUA
MATKRGLSGTVIHRNRNSGGGSRFPIAILVFFSVLASLVFFVGRGLYFTTSIDGNDFSSSSSNQVIDVIKANTDDLGPLSFDFLRKHNLSASWKLVGQEISVENNGTPAEQLREKRRQKRATDLEKKDDEVTVKLESAAIERSKSVDSAVLGKYSIWRKENENENSDSTVRLIRDQMIMARVYLSLATMKNKLDLAHELQICLKESQRAVGEASADSDLHQSAPAKIKAMGQVLSKAREQLYDCKLVTGKLRAMLQTADEQVRSLKKQSTFLSQLAAKTIPNGIHCLSMRLTIEYYLLAPEKRQFPRQENLENPKLYHYALFSDNVLATSVVVNSAIMNAKV